MRRQIVLAVVGAIGFAAVAMGDTPPVSLPAPSAAATAPGQPPTLEQQLAEKCAQRDQLQREIEAIIQALQGGEQVILRLEVVEIDLTKARRLGFAPALEPGREMTAEHRGELLRRLADLRKNNLAKALMNPTLVTVSGRPASILSGDGEEIVVTTANGSSEVREFGTRVEVLPVVQADGRLRVEVRPRISRRGAASDATASDGSKVPRANVAESVTTCNVGFGETAVAVGAIEQRTTTKRGALGRVSETFDIATVVIVTAERVSAVSPAGYSTLGR